jgi:SAM-dependent methyltransferase
VDFAVTLAARLRRRAAVADDEFDRLYPPEVQYISDIQWTPVDVAQRVAAWVGAGRVLDVGSGVGKLCLVASLAGDGDYTGVEQDPARHAIAAHAGARLGSGARFLCGDALDLDWSAYDCFYFYNPFQRLLLASPAAGQVCLDGVVAKLAAQPPGARVVLFHGLGADLPGGYVRERHERCGWGDLELFVRRA